MLKDYSIWPSHRNSWISLCDEKKKIVVDDNEELAKLCNSCPNLHFFTLAQKVPKLIAACKIPRLSDLVTREVIHTGLKFESEFHFLILRLLAPIQQYLFTKHPDHYRNLIANGIEQVIFSLKCVVAYKLMVWFLSFAK